MAEVVKATEFTVKRSDWYRGRGASGSRLLRTDGMMCCMGFYAEACGIPPERLVGQSSLSQIKELRGLEDEVVCGGKISRPGFDSTRESLYVVNDSSTIPDDEREARLTHLLAERGVTVHFVD